jgi:hypothetical protein
MISALGSLSRAARQPQPKLVFKLFVLLIVQLLATVSRGVFIPFTDTTHKRLRLSIDFGSLLWGHRAP